MSDKTNEDKNTERPNHGDWKVDLETGEITTKKNGLIERSIGVLYGAAQLDSEAEYKATGHLIEAAPNLLWATEWALERLVEEWGDEGVLTECLEAVIKKAKGEKYDPDDIGPWPRETA